MEELTREQFEFWKNLPETKAILSLVESYQGELRDYLVSGATVGSIPDTAETVGKIHGLGFILGIDYQ